MDKIKYVQFVIKIESYKNKKLNLHEEFSRYSKGVLL